MKEIILAYQGEMTLKGLNRGKFEARLGKIIRWRLEPLGKFKVTQAQSCLLYTSFAQSPPIFYDTR